MSETITVTGWLAQLDSDTREAAFEEMLSIGNKAQMHYRRFRGTQPTGGNLAVGCADFDPWIRSAALSDFLRAVNNGDTPAEAGEKAKASAREAIKQHNSLRKEWLWQRWEGCADEVILWARRKLERATTQEDAGETAVDEAIDRKLALLQPRLDAPPEGT